MQVKTDKEKRQVILTLDVEDAARLAEACRWALGGSDYDDIFNKVSPLCAAGVEAIEGS